MKTAHYIYVYIEVSSIFERVFISSRTICIFLRQMSAIFFSKYIEEFHPQ